MIRGIRAPYSQLSGLGLNMFTDDELAELHRATLDVMANGGIMVMNDEAQEIFYSHGCEVDKKNNIVKIPPYLVEEAIRSAPSKVLLAARDPEYDLALEGTRVTNLCFGVGIKVLDLETGENRESTLKDMTEACILCDSLDGVDMVLQPLTPRDMPVEVGELYAAEAAFNNTAKHYQQGESLTKESVRRVFEMGVAIAGSEEEMRRRPVCSIAICPVSPLQLGSECCEVVMEVARLGIPVNIITMSLSGATSPATLAGTLIVHNAEALGCIVLHQLIRKGAPIIYGSSTTMFDLMDITSPVGAPEIAMISAGVAKLGQYYNLPTFVAGT